MGGPDAAAGLLAGGPGALGTPGGGSAAVDPGGVSPWAEHPGRGPRVAPITEEPVSAQTSSRLTRNVDQAVAQFHQAPLSDDWRYLLLDGGSLRVRRPSGRKRVQLLVAYGVRAEGHAQAFAHRWRDAYPQLVTRLCRDLPELLAFFQCPRALWR